jgi:thiosulfate dehydrogenase
MAPSRPNSRKPSGRSKSSPILPFLFGFLLALLALVGGAWAYFRFGQPPVATADAPFPLEARIVQLPMNARIARQLQQPPFPTSEDAYEAGAHLYNQHCASCHGSPGADIPFAKFMYPVAPQLFKKHAKNNIVGVSDDDPGETFWKIKNGLRLTGMPAYQHLLSDDQMWDIALLLKNADQQLPDPVTAILKSK